MTISPTTGRSWRLAGTTAGLAVLLGLAAACGSSSAGTTDTASVASSSATPSGQAGQNPGGRNGQAANRSAADGTIAAVNGSAMQVQSTERQTTVNFSDSTTITASTTADLTAVTAGLCITANSLPAGGIPASGEAPPSTMPTAVPTSGAGADVPFAATMIQLGDPENGQCSTGFPGGGTPPSGVALPSGGVLPSGAPDFGGTPPSGVPQAGPGGFGNRASGKVASVSGDTIVISETDPTSQAVTQRTVTVDSTTTYTKRAAATTAALVVGQCAVVQGSTDSKGAVTATSVAVSAPTGPTCTTGFGGFGGRGRGANAPTTGG